MEIIFLSCKVNGKVTQERHATTKQALTFGDGNHAYCLTSVQYTSYTLKEW